MMTSKEILSVHAKESGFIMRRLISENKDLIEEVKYYTSNGWSKLSAIDFVLFEEFGFRFSNDNNKRMLLKDWMINKMDINL